MQTITSRLLAALAFPRAIDDFVELAVPLHSTHEIRARIEEVLPETHDVATLVLRPNARFLPHRAGQHVALTASINGVRRTRFFSIASAEGRRDGTIWITVKKRPGGALTPHIVNGSLRGSIVTLSQPAGDFVLPERLPDRLLFISGGSGITPVMSMLRTLLARNWGDHVPEIVFLHWARSEADVIFGAELERLARDSTVVPSLRVHIHTSRFDAKHLEEDVLDFEHWDTWACGPGPILDAALHAFAARNAAARVRIERFSLPSKSVTNEKENENESEVVFTRSQRHARGRGPILAMAEETGLTPQSGCRMGICHSCACRKISGVTRNLRTGEVSTDNDVDIQLCVSAPLGPVEIDL